MALTDTARLTVRSWVGSTDPDDDTLDTYADGLATADPLTVARHVLAQRLADLELSPLRWSVSGDYNEDWVNNITSLRDRLARLDADIAGTASLNPVVRTAGSLTRTDRNRLFLP